ncbi:MAG: hypothetical protein FD134_1860 [Gallionellaceae bacterium]|nr:MAG: hypothetical protein FD134_1860 [Gallionellaceae bacterium]
MAGNQDANPSTKALIKADAAKLVKREVPIVGDNGKPTGKMRKVEVGADEVLDFAVRDDGAVVVVTVDGKKLFGSVKA